MNAPGKVALEDMVDVVVHMAPVTQPLDGPVSVAVSGPGRKMPDAKDSKWARDRQVLEAQLPAGASEGLLCTADGAVLESFVSNFFVVRGEFACPRSNTFAFIVRFLAAFALCIQLFCGKTLYINTFDCTSHEVNPGKSASCRGK